MRDLWLIGAKSSTTSARDFAARSLWLCTTIPFSTTRIQDAANTRSPSISTMHARQFPSERYPGSGL